MRNVTCIRSQSVIAILLGSILAGGTRAQEAVELTSPDGKIKVAFRVAQLSGAYPKGARPYYSVTYGDQALVLDSPLGFEIEGVPELSADLTVVTTDRQAADTTWQRVCGKSKTVRDHYNELRVTLATVAEPQRTFDIVWRAYDDGVAFRYFLLDQAQLKQFRLIAERSWFRFAGDHTVWAANYERFESPQETEFFQKRLSNIAPGSVYGLPLLVKAGDNAWVAVAEANLTDWAGMYVTGLSGVANTVCTRLAPYPADPKVRVVSQTPRYSPWRVLMIAPEPGKLIESNIIDNLSEPCALADTSWIKPGKCAWDWWWSGGYAPDVSFKLGPNNETMKYFIDFAAEMGWQYQLVDWQWYGPPFDAEIGGAPHPTSDITTPIPGIDIPTLVQYAGQKGVRLFVWLHWAHANKQMDEAFPLYEKWGVAGVKIDFMNRDDQEMV
ncbi:MAG: glycoside hydrolase family 97 N-terminal domain-containing protein, partial [Sedimentisphaerales bacterium]|nr:glycoside hydrolase family 97 N-terminal domain-containing protein [Sedimentisphaerales bacterium]